MKLACFNIEVTRTSAARCREENGRFSSNQFLYYYSHMQLIIPAASPHHKTTLWLSYSSTTRGFESFKKKKKKRIILPLQMSRAQRDALLQSCVIHTQPLLEMHPKRLRQQSSFLDLYQEILAAHRLCVCQD